MEEGAKVDEKELLTRSPLPYGTRLVIIGNQENGEHQATVYSVTDDCYYVRAVPELQNKHIRFLHNGFMFLKDKCTEEFSLLNISTMEKVQLPPLLHFSKLCYKYVTCVMSSSHMDQSCHIAILDILCNKLSSCQLGDSEWIEREWTGSDPGTAVNLEGRLHVLDFNYIVMACDFQILIFTLNKLLMSYKTRTSPRAALI